MNRDEFEEMMTQDGWTTEQRQKFDNFTPISDAETFRREMSRPDGMVECKRRDESIKELIWKRVFKTKAKWSAEESIIRNLREGHITNVSYDPVLKRWKAEMTDKGRSDNPHAVSDAQR